MSQCDLCGKDNAPTKARIEGTLLQVCTACAAFGEIVQTGQKLEVRGRKSTDPKLPTIDHRPITSDLRMITPDYAQKIKTAREKEGLKQEEVAQRINEKVTLIQKVEAGTPPSIPLAQKLEQFFKIQIIIPYTEERVQKETEKTSELTIGDILSTKKESPTRKVS